MSSQIYKYHMIKGKHLHVFIFILFELCAMETRKKSKRRPSQPADKTRPAKRAAPVPVQQDAVGEQASLIQQPTLQQGPEPGPSQPASQDQGHMGNVIDLQLFDNIPVAIPSNSSLLGFHVNSSVKDKIVQGSYVDLANLLSQPGQLSQEGGKLIVNANGHLTVSHGSQKRINTIEEWSDAFLVFASIYLSAHVDQTQELLKYFSVIRLAAKRYRGMGWLSYDTQFRLRMATNPGAISFGLIDQELWMLSMGPSTLYNSGGEKKCYDYNYRSCFRVNCPYRHCCLHCSGNHTLQTCRRYSGTSSGQIQTRPNLQRPSFRGGFRPRPYAMPSRPRFMQN